MSVEYNPRVVQAGQEFTAALVKAMPDATTAADTQFREHQTQQFSTEGDSGGERWQSLSPEYEKRKKKLRPGRKILVWDGPLRASLARKGGEHIADWFRNTDRFFIQLGSRNRIGPYHEAGGRNLPRRSMLQMTEHQSQTLMKKISSALAPHAARAIRDTFRIHQRRS